MYEGNQNSIIYIDCQSHYFSMGLYVRKHLRSSITQSQSQFKTLDLNGTLASEFDLNLELRPTLYVVIQVSIYIIQLYYKFLTILLSWLLRMWHFINLFCSWEYYHTYEAFCNHFYIILCVIWYSHICKWLGLLFPGHFVISWPCKPIIINERDSSSFLLLG